MLTRRFINGQRTRYVSPLALFLFTGFLMFFVVSLAVEDLHAPNIDPAAQAAAHDELVAEVDRARRQVEARTAALAEARRTGRGAEAAEEALSDAQKELTVAQTGQHWAETPPTSFCSC